MPLSSEAASPSGELVVPTRGAGKIPAEQMIACELTPLLLQYLDLPLDQYVQLFTARVPLDGQLWHKYHPVKLDHHLDTRYDEPDEVMSVAVNKTAFSIIRLANVKDLWWVGHQNGFRITGEGKLHESEAVTALDNAAMRVFAHVPQWFGWQ